MLIKFLEDRTVDDGSGTTYRAGQVVEVTEQSANHWISRGVAVEHVEPVTPEPVEQSEPVKKTPVKRAFRTRNRSN